MPPNLTPLGPLSAEVIPPLQRGEAGINYLRQAAARKSRSGNNIKTPPFTVSKVNVHVAS